MHPPSVHFLSFSCNFRQFFFQIRAQSYRVGAPFGKSWVSHWYIDLWWHYHEFIFYYITRMHSSRMRTARPLTVVGRDGGVLSTWSRGGGGCCPPGPWGRGVLSTWSWGRGGCCPPGPGGVLWPGPGGEGGVVHLVPGGVHSSLPPPELDRQMPVKI